MVQKNGHIAEKIHDQFERTNIREKLRKNIEFMNFCKFILKDRNFWAIIMKLMKYVKEYKAKKNKMHVIVA